MNLKELLSNEGEVRLNEIAIRLKCIDARERYLFTRRFLIEKIFEGLHRFVDSIIIERERDNILLNEAVILDLKRLCLGVEPSAYESVLFLKDLGMVFERNVVAYDIKDKLLKKLRLDYTYSTDGTATTVVKHTPFLSLFMVLDLVRKGKIASKDTISLLNINNNQKVIRYLRKEGIINNSTDLQINEHIFRKWLEPSALIGFYQFYLEAEYSNALGILNTIYLMQVDYNMAIKKKDIVQILETNYALLQRLEELGLVLQLIIKDETYIMLSNEAWFLLSGKEPVQWANDNLIVTTDFELFVPYNFNPFKVSLIGSFGQLVNKIVNDIPVKKKYSRGKKSNNKSKKELNTSDYFLIFNIEKSGDKAKKYNYRYKEFHELVEDCKLPDLVKDNFNLI